MKNKLIILSILLLSTKAICQVKKSEMAVYNVGLGAVVGGIGAVINKKKNERFGKVLLKGAYQGAMGGYLVYESKNLLGKISSKQKLEYSWSAKFVNSAGISIIENASLNKNFWEKWHLNIGFNRFEFHTKDKFRFSYRIMPVSMILTGYTAIGNRFDLIRTLKTGEPIFSNNKTSLSSLEANGINYGNAILINTSKLSDTSVIAHEIVHTYQYYDFNFVNSYYRKPFKNISENSKFLKRFNKIFYLDLQGPVLRGLYLMESSSVNYYYNFFENEAGFWSNTIR